MAPRGIEILVKKASVDRAFRGQLLEERSGAAGRIDLELDTSEEAILDAIPEEQLLAIIGSTRVNLRSRPAFMGYAAAAMLAAVGVTSDSVFAESDINQDGTENPGNVEEKETPIFEYVAGIQPTLTGEERAASIERYVSLFGEGKGYIEGLVVWHDGDDFVPIKNASIEEPKNGMTTLSDDEGYFCLDAVPVGEYTIIIRHDDYLDMSFSVVNIEEGLGTSLEYVEMEEEGSD